jgi:hypothetical protein
MWMWAATARPVSLLKVSRQAIEPLAAPVFVTVAENVPRARFALPFGLGTSWRALSADVTRAVTAI